VNIQTVVAIVATVIGVGGLFGFLLVVYRKGAEHASQRIQLDGEQKFNEALLHMNDKYEEADKDRNRLRELFARKRLRTKSSRKPKVPKT